MLIFRTITIAVFIYFSLGLLIECSAESKPKVVAKKQTDVRVTLEAEVAVILRDEIQHRMYILLASSRGLVHSRRISKPEDRLIAVQVAAPDSGRITELVNKTQPSAEPPTIPAWLQRWSSEAIDATDVLVGAMNLKDQAAWQGPNCERCQLRQRLGFIALSSGLEAKQIDAWTAVIGPNLQDQGQTLLQMGERLSHHWPSRLPIRSAYFAVIEDDNHIVEDLVIDWDLSGRASSKLAGLHRWHLAEVQARADLSRSWYAFTHKNKKEQRRSAVEARHAMQAALRAFRGVALWHAQLALALALEWPRNDSALKPMQEALSLAPRSAQIRRICARIYRVRGDWKQAGEYLATALRLRPDEPAIRRELEYVLRQQNLQEALSSGNNEIDAKDVGQGKPRTEKGPGRQPEAEISTGGQNQG